ncbi:AMP-dependent synthetase [Actinomycetospora sp. NBRC 106375]|uniref:AMP-binding protein n=1 Tax=Actinomycetospora sp. NBRC 106375 TaxID=3032207 RepID=UPI0024A0B51D|nr:AMP-binding protein [Actinomycetospora sp. NBRC 106375]GLZ46722.1 AMP-dependent synthetase [Actinomycetospora sp. NBRC 106375]
MQVPFEIQDFLDRAEIVYGARTGIVDEPDQPATPLTELTYARVAALARAQAAGLDAMGIGFGERVAIVSHNSARLLVSFFGVSGHGRVLVPVNFRLSVEEVTYIVEQSGASLLLVDPELEEQLKGVPCARTIVLGEQGDQEMYRFGVDPEPWEPDEDATATINYTSGTTARPKGVELTHRNLWVNATTFSMHLGVNDRDVYLHTLPMFHANGWGMPYGVTGLGAKHIVLRKVDGAEILRRVEAHGVTVLCAAPAVISAVLGAAAEWQGEIPGRGRVRIVGAGAPPPTRTIAQVEEVLGWEFVQIYGLTETSPLLTFNRTRAEWDDLETDERAARLGRAGAPALGVKVRISDDGEVLARSNVILKSYWERPDETEKVLKDGWFHTGDGGTVDDDGYLTISDRRKDVIISGGENVSSIEVEDTLFNHPAVAEVAVIGVPDEKWGETIKALVVLAPGAHADEADLIEHCKAHLARYKAPTSIEFRDGLARTATGKLQKFKLRAEYWEGRDRQVN